MKKQWKLQDVLLIALLVALYFVIYMAVMIPVSMLGAFGHSISPGLCGLVAGAIFIFLNRKVGKMGEYSLFMLLIMGAFALVGGGYLPWVISSVGMALLADLLASHSKDTPIWKLAIASGMMHVGQAWGSIIPATFFMESFRSHWIARGQSAADMDAQIHYTRGLMGGLSTILVFALAFIGIYIGQALLKKHLEKSKR